MSVGVPCVSERIGQVCRTLRVLSAGCRCCLVFLCLRLCNLLDFGSDFLVRSFRSVCFVKAPRCELVRLLFQLFKLPKLCRHVTADSIGQCTRAVIGPRTGSFQRERSSLRACLLQLL